MSFPRFAFAVSSGELYTSTSYGYGRVEARIRFAAGDGVVSSFFLWKDGSELTGTFWNELDFEKLGADCHVESNAIFGNPPGNHGQKHTLNDPCGAYHTYAYEWTPDAIAWLVDGVEIRRDTGATAVAFAENATGMQVRFNVWPGDASFGGNFSPSILPVHQYVDWVQFSSYEAGAFTVQWREDFDAAALPAGWLTASWASPKNLSTHVPGNVNVIDGHLVISLTADDAVGPAGAMPGDGGGGSAGGSAGSGPGGGAGGDSGGVAGSAGSPSSGGTAGSAGDPTTGGGAGSAGSPASGAAGGAAGSAGSGSAGGGSAGDPSPAAGSVGVAGVGGALAGSGGNATSGAAGSTNQGSAGSEGPG
ncbi:MAG TPA: family 16 glycosylhydrolase, partial [Polyangiaceae bacterium]